MSPIMSDWFEVSFKTEDSKLLTDSVASCRFKTEYGESEVEVTFNVTIENFAKLQDAEVSTAGAVVSDRNGNVIRMYDFVGMVDVMHQFHLDYNDPTVQQFTRKWKVKHIKEQRFD